MHHLQRTVWVGIVAACLSAPASANFTSFTSGLTTTYTETFEGSTSFSGGRQNAGNDDYLVLDNSTPSAFASFTFAALASLQFSFYYTGSGPGNVGSVAITGPNGNVFSPVSFSSVSGTNPGPSTGTLYSSSTFSNLAAGTYTLTFARQGAGDTFRVDDVVVTVSAVPEPTTIALMLAGLGVVALKSRRRLNGDSMG